MKICGKALPPRAALLLTLDVCLLTGVLPFLVASPGLLLGSRREALPSVELFSGLVLTGIACQVVFYYNELYNLQLIRSSSHLLLSLLQGTGMALLLLALLFLALPGRITPDLHALLVFSLLATPLAYGIRRLALPRAKEAVLVVGSGEQASELMDVVQSCPEWNMNVAEIAHAHAIRMRPVPGSDTGEGIDRVIVCPDLVRDDRLLHQLLGWKLLGINVEDATNFYERATGRVRVDYLTPEWFVFSSGFENGRRKRAVKRALDLAVATPLLLLTLPVMAAVALAILAEGKGPPLFMQDRIGLHGRRFRIFKFRTMVPRPVGGAESWVTADVSRITPLGSALRRFRLDELPQLWNVLNGSMSLVGPRPEQPGLSAMLAERIPFYQQRHTVPPGLTGWAQVRYHYGASVEESQRKLEFDLFYVKHLSSWLDLAILVETVKVVLVGRGAR